MNELLLFLRSRGRAWEEGKYPGVQARIILL